MAAEILLIKPYGQGREKDQAWEIQGLVGRVEKRTG